MILIVDEEAQGSKEEFWSVDKLKREVVKYIDESVEEITIKKRTVYSEYQYYMFCNCDNHCNSVWAC